MEEPQYCSTRTYSLGRSALHPISSSTRSSQSVSSKEEVCCVPARRNNRLFLNAINVFPVALSPPAEDDEQPEREAETGDPLETNAVL